MNLDNVARGLAVGEIARQKRLRTLYALRDSMGRSGIRPLELASTLPTIGAGAVATAIATGTTYQPYTGGAATASLSRFTFAGADAAVTPGGYPFTEMVRLRGAWLGDGTAPNIQTVPVLGGRIRWATTAPLFEIYFLTAAAGLGNGFRLKVDGKYVATGVKGVDGNGLLRFIPVQWGDGSATYRKMRYYEMEIYGVGSFIGLRMGPLDRPQAWPQPDGLRGIIVGDSFDATVFDSGDHDAYLTPALGFQLADLLGQCDTTSAGVGSSGWTKVGATNTTAMRWPYDVTARSPDFVIEHSGGNDNVSAGTQAAYEAVIDSAVRSTFAAKPETIIFMFSYVSASSFQYVHAAKQTIALRYPKNIALIDTYTDPPLYGSGYQGATTGDGNRDWALGPDAAHPTMLGHDYLASTMARGVAKAIPLLIAAQWA